MLQGYVGVLLDSCVDGLQAADEQTGSKAAMSAVGVPQKRLVIRIIRSGDEGKQFLLSNPEYTLWWQLKHFFFLPRKLGKKSHFD